MTDDALNKIRAANYEASRKQPTDNDPLPSRETIGPAGAVGSTTLKRYRAEPPGFGSQSVHDSTLVARASHLFAC
jgi:hypothetical protein